MNKVSVSIPRMYRATILQRISNDPKFAELFVKIAGKLAERAATDAFKAAEKYGCDMHTDEEEEITIEVTVAVGNSEEFHYEEE